MSARRDDQALADALVEALAASPRAVARLRELVGEPAPPPPTPPAYTVASLATALGLSPKAVRNAIARRELAAAAGASQATPYALCPDTDT